MDINRVALTGRLTKDIDIRQTNSNKKVGSFTIAVNKAKDKADFINCIAWENTAELINQYCKKGYKIGVEGRLQTRQYDTDNGKRYITEIVVDNVAFLESRKEATQQSTPQFNIDPNDIPF